MVFILSNELDADIRGAPRAFERYRASVRERRNSFPPSAFALAISDWYHNFHDHRCPHDARLEEIRVFKPGAGSENKPPLSELEILLQGAYDDGRIRFRYSNVFRYSLVHEKALPTLDWRYDEFRISDDGHLVHEIEWWDNAQRRVDIQDGARRVQYGSRLG